MDPHPSLKSILDTIRPRLVARDGGESGSVAVMTCGIAGSGKTTLTRAIIQEFPSFHRVSIDEIIASRHGIYNVDYPPSKHKEYEAEADQVYLETVERLLKNKENVVIERSFYAKEDRDEFKTMIEKAGGRWILVYLKAERDLLWRRINERRAEGLDANCALDIDENLLDRYIQGFEAPVGEGEIVINVQ